MARTACSEACLAVCLHENSFSVSRELAAQVTAPLSSGRAARSRRILVSWVIFCSGRLLGCLEIQYGHKQLGMEQTTTNSLVPFQPFQPGRMKLRHPEACFLPLEYIYAGNSVASESAENKTFHIISYSNNQQQLSLIHI